MATRRSARAGVHRDKPGGVAGLRASARRLIASAVIGSLITVSAVQLETRHGGIIIE